MMLRVVVFTVPPVKWCPPGASEGDLIGKLDFCRCNQLRSSWFKVNPDFSESCLRKREERENLVERQGITQARRDRGRGWSDWRSFRPGDTRGRQEAESEGRGLPRRLQRGHGLAVPLTPDFQPTEHGEDQFCCFNQFDLTATCYHRPRNLEQCVLGWSIRNDRFRRLLWPIPTRRLHMVPPAVPWAPEGKTLVTRESFLGNCWWNWN